MHFSVILRAHSLYRICNDYLNLGSTSKRKFVAAAGKDGRIGWTLIVDMHPLQEIILYHKGTAGAHVEVQLLDFLSASLAIACKRVAIVSL